MVKSLKIGLIMPTDKRWMGGVIYIQNLVKAIASLKSSKIEIYLIIPLGLDKDLYKGILPFVHKLCVEPSLSLNWYNRVWWAFSRKFPFIPNKHLSDIVKRENLDFLYPITGFYGFYWKFDCSWAAWIPDFQHKYLPEFSNRRKSRKLDRVFERIGRNAPFTIFSSFVALKDFERFYPNSVSRNFVINFRTVPKSEWFTQDPVFVQQKYQLPDRFFLVSNQFWKHKNHKIIIESLIILEKENIRPVIVCTGKVNDSRFPSYGQEIIQLIRKFRLNKQVKILGLIPRQEQIQLMRRAIAVIQPSLFEGWSTVVEDARALGKVIILSDIPVHIEQKPPNSHYFHHSSPEDLANKIKNLFNTLAPGPNILQEKISQNIAHEQSQNYAEAFIRIAKDCQSKEIKKE